MKTETRLAILEAFACSKPTEFDGFVLRYLEAHPEPPETTPLNQWVPVEAEVTVEAPKPVSKRGKKTVEVIPSEQ